MTTRKRRVVTKKAEQTVYTVKDNEVVVDIIPEEVLEVESEEEVSDDGKPSVKFQTPQGEAVYEFARNCVDCGYKRPPVERAVFVHKEGTARADEQMGLQLASFRRDGKSSSALCRDCYEVWRGQQPHQEARYKVM